MDAAAGAGFAVAGDAVTGRGALTSVAGGEALGTAPAFGVGAACFDVFAALGFALAADGFPTPAGAAASAAALAFFGCFFAALGSPLAAAGAGTACAPTAATWIPSTTITIDIRTSSIGAPPLSSGGGYQSSVARRRIRGFGCRSDHARPSRYRVAPASLLLQALLAPIFEGGKLRAQVEQAKGGYDEALGNYRTAVLQALADVENGLTDLGLLQESGAAYQRAADATREDLRLVQLEYDQGLVDYLQVLDAQRTWLGDELLAAQTLGQRYVSSVLLVKALGGGWSVDDGARVLDAARARGPE